MLLDESGPSAYYWQVLGCVNFLSVVVFGIPLTTFQFAAYFRTLPRETIDAAKDKIPGMRNRMGVLANKSFILLMYSN